MNRRIEDAIIEAARALTLLAQAQKTLAFEARRANEIKERLGR